MQLSYSSLSIRTDCPRCFYLDRKLKISRPQGIKSGIPNAVDGLIKLQMEKYHGALPPALQGIKALEGFVVYAGPDMAKMRHWKSNPYKMTDENGNVIVGAFDALLHHPKKNLFAYLDYKSTGKEPNQEFGEKYYQAQCDNYTEFLIQGKKEVADFGVLLFFWPVAVEGGMITFASKAILLKPNPASARKIFKDAIDLLEGDVPEPIIGCEYCEYVIKSGGVQ